MPKTPEPTIIDPEDSVKGIHSSEIRLLRQTSARSDRWKKEETFPDTDAGLAEAHARMISAESARGGVWRIVRATEEILEKWD